MSAFISKVNEVKIYDISGYKDEFNITMYICFFPFQFRRKTVNLLSLLNLVCCLFEFSRKFQEYKQNGLKRRINYSRSLEDHIAFVDYRDA